MLHIFGMASAPNGAHVRLWWRFGNGGWREIRDVPVLNRRYDTYAGIQPADRGEHVALKASRPDWGL